MSIGLVVSGFLLAWVALAGLLAATTPEAESAEPAPRYDPATVVEIQGKVSAIREMPQTHSLSGLHLIVSTKTGEIDAYLGPIEFLSQFEIMFSPGNNVQIVGSKVKFGGRPVVLSREVRKREAFLYLRDSLGYPNWPVESIPSTSGP
jgi:hypothetical protein